MLSHCESRTAEELTWNHDRRTMIVSHAHRLIFIKTWETAGTCIEGALSAICGADDVITPHAQGMDRHRCASAQRPPQNFRFDHPLVPRRPLIGRLITRRDHLLHPSVGFYDHMPAWRIKAYLGDEIWGQYYKFAFERNPWDRQVSRYLSTIGSEAAEARPSFDIFLRSRRRAYVDNFELYSIDGAVAVDFLGRYEDLEADFARALGEAGVTEEIFIDHTEYNLPRRRDYRVYYTDTSRKQIANWYAREINLLGYHF